MPKRFKVVTKESAGLRIIGAIARFFKKRPEIINLNNEPFETRCIMIGNHNGAGGAFNYRAFLRKYCFMTWGAHQMCGGYASRFKYLYKVFYRQKLGYGRLKAFFSSISFGLVSGVIYDCAGIIPVYYDMRIASTYKHSLECIKKNVSVFIFPENSDKGYKEVPDELHPGFLQLARLYYKKYNYDLPVYTMYYHRRPKKIVIGRPMYLRELGETLSDSEILKKFRNYMEYLRSICEGDGKNLIIPGTADLA